jgi:hypothetical protein
MKSQVVDALDYLLLRKRSIFETINDLLKNIFDHNHSRHQSLINYLSNVVACLVTFSYPDKKTVLNLHHTDGSFIKYSYWKVSVH